MVSPCRGVWGGGEVTNGRLWWWRGAPAGGRGEDMADSRTPAGVEASSRAGGGRGDEVIERLPSSFAARRRARL